MVQSTKEEDTVAREVSTVNTGQDDLLDTPPEGRASGRIPGRHGLIEQTARRRVERALAAELTAHSGCDPRERAGGTRGNAHNGGGANTVLRRRQPADRGAVRTDRAGTVTNPPRPGEENSEGAKKKPLVRGASDYWA